MRKIPMMAILFNNPSDKNIFAILIALLTFYLSKVCPWKSFLLLVIKKKYYYQIDSRGCKCYSIKMLNEYFIVQLRINYFLIISSVICYIVLTIAKSFEPGHAKMCLMPYANNKGADQPAHPRSLISAFVVRFLDSVISLVLDPKFQDSS